ncbi:tudor domain-containing protein 1-like [Xenia sp. Carnegie-2017]|uniref:tudor domain-containing protein 1-like n=1 Tax=Xenia sp. Carnegie-2017 TaxID=2897299 RepID=UPI001F04E6CA|nr:tudor domain-containing protein 1-like [Xenia sp. Carnegie-2017]
MMCNNEGEIDNTNDDENEEEDNFDYGNMERLSTSRIKEIKAQFLTLLQQAIPCSLYGIKPRGVSWSDEAITKLQEVVVDKEMMIEVISHNDSQHYGVALMQTIGEECYSINKEFIQKGYAVSNIGQFVVTVGTNITGYQFPTIEIPGYEDVEVTHVENLDTFWCHLTDSATEMENLMTNLQDYYDVNPPKSTDLDLLKEGSPCCARFSEDQMWYRGRINQ